MKLPVITTDIRGCREEVLDEYNGIIIDPYDSKQLVGAIKRLIENKRLRLLFGQNSYLRAKENFDEIKLYKRIEGNYNKLL